VAILPTTRYDWYKRAVITNELGQVIGAPVEGWTRRADPPSDAMNGRHCRLERLDPDRHCAQLHAHNRLDVEGRNWTYLPYGPFTSVEEHHAWATAMAAPDDPQFWAVIDLSTGEATGVASFLRIDPGVGVIEVGHINFSPTLQRTVAATEAMHLMMRRVFDELGYRRYEWKCDALNAPSRAAAQRLGFTYEGVFRQATIYKGRNRDTAWYSILDVEWPAIDRAMRAWLDPSNFDAGGRRHLPLAELRTGAPDRPRPI